MNQPKLWIIAIELIATLFLSVSCKGEEPDDVTVIPHVEGKFVDLINGVYFTTGLIHAETNHNRKTAFAITNVGLDGRFIFTNLKVPKPAATVNFRSSTVPDSNYCMSDGYVPEFLISGKSDPMAVHVFCHPRKPRYVDPLTAELRGEVWIVDTDRPIPNATISLKIHYKCGGRSSIYEQVDYSTKTDQNGKYSINKLEIYRKVFGSNFEDKPNCHIGTISDLKAIANGFHQTRYTPIEASEFIFDSNEYTRNFWLKSINEL